VLDDLLANGLKLVICGSAAGHRSAELRQYYAGPGNKFWRTLADVKLTPRQLAPSEYGLLPSFGIGLTDLVKSQSGGDHEISFDQDHVHRLRTKIETYQPRYFCFNGKRAAKEFFARDQVAFGLQTDAIGATRVFVAPSTSAAANGAWNPAFWRELADRASRE
jgi:TDG/mug DNA glycosylase family protein